MTNIWEEKNCRWMRLRKTACQTENIRKVRIPVHYASTAIQSKLDAFNFFYFFLNTIQTKIQLRTAGKK